MNKLSPPPFAKPLIRRAVPVIASVALAAAAGCTGGESVGVQIIPDDGGEPGEDAGTPDGDAGN